MERRSHLAKIIMDLARQGEADGTKLRQAAVADLKKYDWIRHQAHELWEGEGRPHGRDDIHWAQAEQEFERQKRDGI